MVKIIQNFRNYIYNRQIEVLELQISNEELEINVYKKHLKETQSKMIKKELDKVKSYLYPYELKTLNQEEFNEIFVNQEVNHLKKNVELLINGINYKKNLRIKQNPDKQKEYEDKASSRIDNLNLKLKKNIEKVQSKYLVQTDDQNIINEHKIKYEYEKKQKYLLFNQQKELITKNIDDKFNLLKEKINQKNIERKEKLNKLLELKKALNITSQIHTLDDEHILSIDNLVMKFGGLTAVDHLSFNVKKGEVFGLIGPNGAGKTTVFNCITQFYKSNGGKITFLNNKNDVVNLNNIKTFEVIKHGIVRTFQNVELVWELSILDNLLVAAHTLYRSNLLDHILHSRRYKFESDILREKALKILTDLDLIKYKDFYPIGLPYGVLKIVELARTLIANPKLIILDEPAAGLNEMESKKLIQTIRKIQSEYQATIFLVEHDMSLVMELCDTICAISFGKMLAIGTPSEIQKNKLVQEAYLGGE
jgi:branched-chain amino acid transport system ATP-binding protein